MKKVIGILAGIALLGFGMTARATMVDPSTIHVNDGTTYLYTGDGDPELHKLIDPATITLLSPDVTITNLFIGIAVAGSEADGVGTVTVTGSDGTDSGAIGADHMGYVDGSKGQKFSYDDVLLVPGDNSQNYENYHKMDLALVGLDEAQFDIYQFDTGVSLFKGTAAMASFSGLPIGTFVFAYGLGDDGKFYCTPITETGLNVPEPSVMLLFGTGLLGLAGISRKRKKG